MPCVSSLTQTPTADNSASIKPAESISLYLPSSLPQHFRQSPELSAIIKKERWLHVAQADDALSDIQRQCQIILGLWLLRADFA